MHFRTLDLSAAIQNDLVPGCPRKTFAKDEILLFKGDPGDDIFYVEDGWAKAVELSAGGHATFLNDFGPGDIFGYYAAYTKKPRAATIFAKTDLSVRVIPAALFQNYISKDSARSAAMMTYLAQNLRRSAEDFARITLPTEQRVAAFLIYSIEETGNLCVQTGSREDFASHLNLTRETLSRILNRFAKDGIVTLDTHSVTITNRAGLYGVLTK